MADFNFYINRQGIQGRKGDKGDTGFSPTISVGTDTLNEYKLIIANEVNSFETPNLRGNINVLDNGGTYLRYDAETQQISAQGLDAATSTTVGGVLMSTSSDIENMGDNTVITPANLADALPIYLQGEGAVTITQDENTSKTKINVDLSSVNELKSRVSAAEAEIVGIQADISDIDSDVSTLNSVTANHTTSISAINNNIADLNNNKVAKTDFATTESAGIVKVDGTTITVDENGVITSVGGGSTGDVTAAGDNTFTGTNTFNSGVKSSSIATDKFFNSTEIKNTRDLELPDGSTLKFRNPYVGFAPVYKRLELSDGSLYPTDIGDVLIQGSSITLDCGDLSASITEVKNGIFDGNGDRILSQGNVTSADNSITVTKSDKGLDLSLNKDSIVSSDGSITIDKTPQGIDIKVSGGGGDASIDDNNITTTTTYSSEKIVDYVTTSIDSAMTTLNQAKQNTLVSGTNIKTINGQSILGEGDITVGGSANIIDDNVASDTTTYSSNKITNLTSDLINNAIDGQWVILGNNNIRISTATTFGNYTYNINNILPNDGYNYEVKILIYGQNATTNSSNIGVAVSGLVMPNSLYNAGEVILVTDGAAQAASTCGNIIVNASRNVYVYISGSNEENNYFSELGISIMGYRRLGY
jgi:hypothetical protein